jgi:quercetin dioxygenase-like cupin family protein
MQVIDGAGKFSRPVRPFDTHWAEQFRVPDLSVGTYSIPVGGTDAQDPHTEDEIYVITAGRGQFEAGDRRVAVEPGMVIFVAAGEVHRFADITEDLAALVLFGPAEGSRSVPWSYAFVADFVAAFNDGVSSGDFTRHLARFTDDAVMRFENVPEAGDLEFTGRQAYTAAYAERPADDQVELTSDPRDDEGAVVADFVWKRDRQPGEIRLTVTDDDLVSKLVVRFD